MARKIRITAGKAVAEAQLHDTPTAEAICRILPLQARSERWGGEIYFVTPVAAALEADCRDVMLPGELGYWPDGRTFCIFFGPTAPSPGEESRGASAVNVFGHLTGRWDDLRSVPAGLDIRVELIEEAAEAAVFPEVKGAPAGPAGQSEDDSVKPASPEAPVPEPEREPVVAGGAPQSLDESDATQWPVEGSEGTLVPAQSVASPARYEAPVDADEMTEPIPTTPAQARNGGGVLSALTGGIGRPEIYLAVGGIVVAAVAFLLGVLAARGGGPALKSTADKLEAVVNESAANKTSIEDLQKRLDGLDKGIKAGETRQAAVTKAYQELQQKVGAIDGQVSQLRAQVAAAKRQDVEWRQRPNGHFYAITTYALPWQQAKEYAQKAGGYLVSLTDAAENEWVVTTFGEATEFWIGLSDEQEEGKWRWLSNEEFKYANWAPGEPDNFRKNQHYVVINSIVPDRGHLEPGKWKDVSANEVHVAIIERDR